MQVDNNGHQYKVVLLSEHGSPKSHANTILINAQLQGQYLISRHSACGWIVMWMLRKKGVLTIQEPSENCTLAPCLGTKYE